MAAIATRLAISSCNPTHSTRVALHAQTLPFSQLLQSISQNLQLQSRIAGESQHREFIFFCAQPCQCVPSPPVAMPHSTDAPSNRRRFGPEITQTRHYSGPLSLSAVFREIKLWAQSPTHFAELNFQRWSENFRF